jgi:hypothetical protein
MMSPGKISIAKAVPSLPRFALATALICLAVAGAASPAAAQTPEVLQGANGRAAGAWQERQACMKVLSGCQRILFNKETGEIARVGDRVSDGFVASEAGLVREAGRQVRAANPPRTDQVVLTETGALAAPWKRISTCLGDKTSCPELIINEKTREIARVNGKWSKGFGATGVGQQVRRSPAPASR